MHADAAELRKEVTSPGGTTEAALKVLMDGQGLEALMRRAVAAAVKRGVELVGSSYLRLVTASGSEAWLRAGRQGSGRSDQRFCSTGKL